MVPSSTWFPEIAWRGFRLETEAAKNYHLSYRLYTHAPTPRHSVLENLLPKLLHIKAVTILDHALTLWLDANGHPPSRNLHGKLNFLGTNGLIQGVNSLHAIRDRRNNYAHDPDALCDWRLLEEDIATIETSLVALGLARRTLELEWYGERSQVEGSTEESVALQYTVTIGVKEDGHPAFSSKSTVKVHNSS